MNDLSRENWQHHHDFVVIHEQGEHRTRQVLWLTAVTMLVEIAAGVSFGSMALLADGWHMGTHVAAFAITIFAYRYARRHADNPAFSFGTGKVSVLGGFASAVALAVVALVMLVESLSRLFDPQPILFNQAIGVAVLGLLINLLSAYLLQGGHDHEHEYGHHHKQDHNLKAAYLHVLADAVTSLLAILALVSGKYFGWVWMDPVMGVAGSLIITRWAYGLLTDTGPILLDGSMDPEQVASIRKRIEAETDSQVTDLHIWKVGPGHHAMILSVSTARPRSPDHYKALLREFPGLDHVTIEVNRNPSSPPG